MYSRNFVDDAKVMSKGQITIPKKIRSVLGVETGDRVTFIVEGNTVRVVNSFKYALQLFQKQMKDEAYSAGFVAEADVDTWITQSRRNQNSK